MNRIIDCFLFNDEFKMLDFRIKELNDYVDYFILVEGTKTWSGENKPLHFKENKHLFKKYLFKIIHVVVDDFPESDNPWVRENFQRNAINRGLDKLYLDDSDIIVISDCDEIFDFNAIEKFKNQNKHDIMKLEQDLYFYSLENRFPTKFVLARVIRYKKLKEIGYPQKIRDEEYEVLERGGWHFSYFFNTEQISNKIKTYAHQEFNKEEYTNFDYIDECVDGGVYLYENIKLNKIKIEDNNYLPKNYNLLKKMNK